MDEGDVERTLAQSIEDQTGTKPDRVDCPGDLEGEKDASLKCVLEADGTEHTLQVKVTEVDGTDIRFRYEVVNSTASDGSPPSMPETQLEERISTMLEEEVGQRPDRIDCPGDLPGTVGETMTCTLTAGAGELDVMVTVTGVEGTTVNFDIEVEEL